LSQKNGGRFPFQEVYDVVDGRKKAAVHERLLTMPLWGEYFQLHGVSERASEAKVKSRITDLVRYIQSLQEPQSLQQKWSRLVEYHRATLYKLAIRAVDALIAVIIKPGAEPM
jgi:hypothetical protein